MKIYFETDPLQESTYRAYGLIKPSYDADSKTKVVGFGTLPLDCPAKLEGGEKFRVLIRNSELILEID